MQPITLTQGQSYMGGTVQYDTATGKPLAKGATTLSQPATTGTTATPKPVPFLSSESGGTAIQKDLAKLDTITAPKPAPTVVKTQQQLDAESGKHNPYGYDASGKALANPNAGDNSFTADQLTQAGIVDPIKEGLSYNASTGTYYVANNATPDAQKFLESTRGHQQANTSLQTESDWVMGEIKKGISGVDALLADTLSNIASDYQNRKAQLEQANNANLSQMQTQGYRYGTARYSSSLNSQLISTEERAGMQKLSELAVQTQGLVMQAKQAAASQKFDMLSKYMGELDKKRKEQADAAAKLAEEKAKQDKIIADRLRQSTIDTNVSSLLAKGITDPKDILGALNHDSKGNLVGDVSSKDIADAIENLTKDDPQAKNVFEIQKEAAKNGATKEVLTAIAKSPNGTAAISAAGEYLMEGSGVIGEYLFYKRDALARGIVPVDPDTYMTMDANRKAKVAAAANAAGLTTTMTNTALKLSDDYRQDSKEFYTVRDAYNRIQASASDPSAAGDLALIFNYMKLLDPGSTVREGEFANAQNAGSVPDRIQAQYNKVISGERLADTQRTDFVSRSTKLFDSAKKQQDVTVAEYTDRAKKYGVPVDLVVRGTDASSSSSIGEQLIQSEEDAQRKIFGQGGLGDQHPELRSHILQMQKDKIPASDILKWINQQS